MGTTTNYAFRYPAASDAADGPTQIQNLATDVDTRRFSDRICAAFLRATGATTMTTANTNYMIAFATEDLDTANGHDTVTNNSRYTIPSGRDGKFVIVGGFGCTPAGGGTYFFTAGLYKNGTVISGSANRMYVPTNNQFSMPTRTVVASLVAGDYIELGATCDVASQTSSTSAAVQPTLSIFRIQD